MSYNGSGTFQINTTGQPVVAGTVISSTAFNALTADLATGLSTAITKDGQTATTVRIPFAQGISSTLTTDSSSVSTGSIITAGGIGAAKALWVGGLANIAGALTVGGTATFSITPIFSALTASSAIATDASKNLVSVTNTGTGNNVLGTAPTISLPAIDNIKMGYSTTATAAGTTTLTAASNYRQFFTGSTTQTIVLPVTSTLVTGMAYEIENNSTGLLTVNSSGGNLVGTGPAGVCAHAVCIGTTLTTAADWDWDYISTTTITGTGANVLGTSPTITTPTINQLTSAAATALILQSAGTTAITVDTSQNVSIGGSTSYGRTTSALGVSGYCFATDSVGNQADHFRFGTGGTTTGTITRVGGTGVAYNTSSDYRLKENITPFTGALAKVAQLKPCTYTWKLDNSNGEGFIAHELAEVCSQAVHGEKDAVDEDGKPVYQGIDVSFLVATLTAAIQELKALVDIQSSTITALTARITALETK
jgi:hypothetical protein